MGCNAQNGIRLQMLLIIPLFFRFGIQLKLSTDENADKRKPKKRGYSLSANQRRFPRLRLAIGRPAADTGQLRAPLISGERVGESGGGRGGEGGHRSPLVTGLPMTWPACWRRCGEGGYGLWK